MLQITLRKFGINTIVKMENKDILKESDIKNCTSYYFDDINLVMDQNGDFGFSDILSNEKLHKENKIQKKK